MKSFFNRAKNLLDKNATIALLTTLININCLACYVLSKAFLGATFILGAEDIGAFGAISILVIVDFLAILGYVQLIIRLKYNNMNIPSKEVKSALKTSKAIIELNKGNIISSGIYNFDYVTKIERESIKNDEIWCITGDLEEDSQNAELGNVITNNLKRGVVYNYFITHVGGTISNKASLGKQKLTENNKAYEKRLNFFDVNEELVAPDIDIIIYKANNIKERIGFVCVEIGDDQDTYVYQQIDQATLQGIYDKLKSYNKTRKGNNWLLSFLNVTKKVIYFCINNLSFAYLILSACVLAVLGFNKIFSWSSAILFVVPAVIETLIAIILLTLIANLNYVYEEALNEAVENESVLADMINSKGIKLAVDDMKKNIMKDLMKKKSLGHAKDILKIDDKCSTVWLLSDLSHDIANDDFYGWLNDSLTANINLKCKIIYTKGTAAVGRSSKIKALKDKFSNRVEVFTIDDTSIHNIWSKTHGIVFLEKNDDKNSVYISIGSSKDTFYKSVIATEEEISTLLGRLTDIAGIKL